jgi:hypothetical protein
MQALKEVRSRPASFMWIDMACHTEIGEELSIPVDATPTVVVLRPRTRMLSRLSGEYSEESIRMLQQQQQQQWYRY